VVVPLNTLDEASATRIGIDRQQHFNHMERLQAAAGLSQKVQQVFDENNFEPITDPEQNLYGGGFFSDDDRQRMLDIRHTPPAELAQLNLNFDDDRLPELLFRYRARNYPQTLDAREQQRWQEYKRDRFTRADGGASITLDDYMQRIDELLASNDCDASQKTLLAELKAYGESIRTEMEM